MFDTNNYSPRFEKKKLADTTLKDDEKISFYTTHVTTEK